MAMAAKGKIPRALIACAAALLPAALMTHAAETKSPEKPNMVIVIADQWRAKATGYAGDPNVKTPQLDKLAKTSLNFCNVVSVCPVCTPFRAALMTGRFPTSTGMFVNDAYLPSEEICMAELLKRAGYATGYIGKWHLDGHGRESFIPPERRQGWDYWKGAECDHTYNHSHYYEGDSPEKKFWPGYNAYAQTKDAQNYIRSRAADGKPFALVVAFGQPHFPHASAPDELKQLYPPEKIQLPPNVPPEQQAAARREAQGYYAHCTALDKCIGDLVATLDETGLAQNTILVFTSDHGESLGAHGIRPTQKQVAWDETAHVPFLLRFPAAHGSSGRVVRTPLTTPDIFATLLGLAGVPRPATAEGADLAAVVRDAGAAAEHVALYMGVAPFANVGGENNKAYRAIRTSSHTYVRSREGAWLLFDDERDPNQMNNLAGKPEGAALQKELETRLQAELKRIGDDFREPQSYLDEWGYHVRSGDSVGYKPNSPVQSPHRNSVQAGSGKQP
jgi:arylsulfatase A-like enzyme